jgi:hypothetical protein
MDPYPSMGEATAAAMQSNIKNAADDRRDSECTCFVGDGLPRQHANDCAKNTADDRRERYAAAFSTEGVAGAREELNAYADAAMAVADAEIASEYRTGAEWRDKFYDADYEITRLRAELADMTKAAQGAIAEAKERHADAMAQRATIERVRGVLPPAEFDSDNTLAIHPRAVRAALEGESE